MVIGTTGFEAEGRRPSPKRRRTSHRLRAQHGSGRQCPSSSRYGGAHPQPGLRHRDRRGPPPAQGRCPSGTALRMARWWLAPSGATWRNVARLYGRRRHRRTRRRRPSVLPRCAAATLSATIRSCSAALGERVEISHKAGGRMPHAPGSLRRPRPGGPPQRPLRHAGRPRSALIPDEISNCSTASFAKFSAATERSACAASWPA